MEKIQEHIIDYLTSKWIRDLMLATGISSWTIYAIKNGQINRGYKKRILDSIYSFFWIPKDEFYRKSVLISPSKNYLWQFFKIRRERLWYTKKQIAKLIKWEERHVRRFENWYINYNPNSYYFKKILDVYNLTDIEKQAVLEYVQSIKKIIKLEKSENVLYLN